MMQDWPIFCSYLDRLIQRYSPVNYQYTVRDKIRWLRIVWTFCQTIYRTDILVYQLPFPLFCSFAIDIFKHVILRSICLHITYFYSFHCIIYCVIFFTDYSHVSLLLISDSFRPLPMITRASFQLLLVFYMLAKLFHWLISIPQRLFQSRLVQPIPLCFSHTQHLHKAHGKTRSVVLFLLTKQ